MKYDIINVFSNEECDIIVQDFEKNIQHIKLSTDHGVERISSYEIDIKNLSQDIRDLIHKKIKSIIKPITGGKSAMIFGVRYSLDTKPDMVEHYDCNSYSCVITLNNSFEGGGTYFPFTGSVVLPNIGDGVLFKADTLKSYHSAYPITNGVRYVLVIRMEKKNVFRVLFNAIFLTFVDKYIRKNKNKLFKKPVFK